MPLKRTDRSGEDFSAFYGDNNKSHWNGYENLLLHTILNEARGIILINLLEDLTYLLHLFCPELNLVGLSVSM